MFKQLLIALPIALLSLSLKATDFPDSFIQLKPGNIYEGKLEENGVLRFYFVLDSPSNILLESSTPRRSNTVYPNATLFTQAGRTLTRDSSSGQGRNFSIQRQLDPGTYVLRVEDGRGCGSLHGCPEIIRDFQLVFEVTEVTPF